MKNKESTNEKSISRTISQCGVEGEEISKTSNEYFWLAFYENFQVMFIYSNNITDWELKKKKKKFPVDEMLIINNVYNPNVGREHCARH